MFRSDVCVGVRNAKWCITGSYIVVNETKVKVDMTKYAERHQFNFDVALDESVSNEAVYRMTVQPLVGTLLRNGKASCFAYGQTGSGKTHTMQPLPIRAAADIFKYLARPEYNDVTLYLSCFEIYGNKVFDLLNQRKRLNILEDAKKQVGGWSQGVQVLGFRFGIQGGSGSALQDLPTSASTSWRMPRSRWVGGWSQVCSGWGLGLVFSL